jgi:hypothetical protein
MFSRLTARIRLPGMRKATALFHHRQNSCMMCNT